MQRITAIWKSLAIAILCGTLMQLVHAQDTSTSEERNRWAALSHQLEANPLDEGLRKEADDAIHRVIHVNDFHVKLCEGVLNEFKSLDYVHHPAIFRQYFIGAAAFEVEHPDQGNDMLKANIGAVESVLRAYRSILAQQPGAKSKFLDSLLKNQSDGKLDDALRKICK